MWLNSLTDFMITNTFELICWKIQKIHKTAWKVAQNLDKFLKSERNGLIIKDKVMYTDKWA